MTLSTLQFHGKGYNGFVDGEGATGEFPQHRFRRRFRQDAVFSFCLAEGNGRVEEVQDPGGAGIGIGTGASSVEHSLVLGCRCVGNRTWGVFFELQKESSPRRRSRNPGRARRSS